MQPNGAVLGEALCGVFVLAFQRQVDVVVIDKHRRRTGPEDSRFIDGNPRESEHDSPVTVDELYAASKKRRVRWKQRDN